MLAQTPPMGWNSWNTFGHLINEQVIREIADAMVDLGLRDAGYEYVVIDDCWSLNERDENDRLVPDPEKFPSGMKALSDYVHSKGLKFGMYSCAGCMTCARRPGSFDHEYLDAQTFADWGVDFLKYDFCYVPKNVDGPSLYRRMSMALKATGREILFSACNWGSDEVEKWIRSTGAHMYRSTGDICDNPQSYIDISTSQIDKLAYSAPGCYNDIDMLICGMGGKGNVGAGGCTPVQYKSHFALWCLYQSPLMIGADIRSIDEETLALLKNKELLSILNDPEARTAAFIRGGDRRSFVKVLANNELLIALFNFTDQGDCMTFVDLTEVGVPSGSGYGLSGYEIFTGEETGLIRNYLKVDVPAYDCKLFRLKLRKI